MLDDVGLRLRQLHILRANREFLYLYLCKFNSLLGALCTPWLLIIPKVTVMNKVFVNRPNVIMFLLCGINCCKVQLDFLNPACRLLRLSSFP